MNVRTITATALLTMLGTQATASVPESAMFDVAARRPGVSFVQCTDVQVDTSGSTCVRYAGTPDELTADIKSGLFFGLKPASLATTRQNGLTAVTFNLFDGRRFVFQEALAGIYYLNALEAGPSGWPAVLDLNTTPQQNMLKTLPPLIKLNQQAVGAPNDDLEFMLSPDRKFLASANSNGRVSISVGGKTLWSTQTQASMIFSLAWSNDQSFVYAMSSRGDLIVLDAKTGEQVITFEDTGGLHLTVLSDDRIFTGNGIFNPARNAYDRLIERGYAVSTDGTLFTTRTLGYPNGDRSLDLQELLGTDRIDGPPVARTVVPNWCEKPTFSPDAKRIAVMCSGALQMINVADGKVLYRTRLFEDSFLTPNMTVFSPSGRYILIGGGVASPYSQGLDRALPLLLDAASGRVLAALDLNSVTFTHPIWPTSDEFLLLGNSKLTAPNGGSVERALDQLLPAPQATAQPARPNSAATALLAQCTAGKLPTTTCVKLRGAIESGKLSVVSGLDAYLAGRMTLDAFLKTLKR